jgi:hypothetical protein
MKGSRQNTLIFVTQLLSPADSVLGFVPTYLSPLSRRVELRKEQGHSCYRRFLRYEAVLNRLARERGQTSLVAHMCPVYFTLAARIVLAAGFHSVLGAPADA